MNKIYLHFTTRFVDRDMVMRFHWGLGIGHVYSHADSPNVSTVSGGEEEDEDHNSDKNVEVKTQSIIDDDEDDDEENPEELGLEDREKEIWDDSDEGDEPGISNGEGYESSVGEEELELEATYSGDLND